MHDHNIADLMNDVPASWRFALLSGWLDALAWELVSPHPRTERAARILHQIAERCRAAAAEYQAEELSNA